MNAFLPMWEASEEPADAATSSTGDEPVPSAAFRATALLDVRGLTISLGARPDAPVLAAGISLSVARGDVIGLVGLPGSGTAEIARALAGLLRTPAVISSGSILLDGQELVGTSRRALARLRGQAVALVPADTTTVLAPDSAVGRQLARALRAKLGLSHAAAAERVLELLHRVGIADPGETAQSAPRQLDPATLRLVVIAAAVSCRPDLLILEEPTATLDAEPASTMVALYCSLRQEYGPAIIVVSRDIDLVAATCGRVAVVDAGRIVEQGSVAEIVADPRHSHTRHLLDAARADPG